MTLKGKRSRLAAIVAGALFVIGALSLAAGTLLTVASAIYPTCIAAWTSPVEAMRAEV